MILQMRRNRHEVMTLLSTGFMLPTERCELMGAAAVMESMKAVMFEHASIMPSGYWFEVVIKDSENRERTYEVPAEIDSGDSMHEWFLMEVQQ